MKTTGIPKEIRLEHVYGNSGYTQSFVQTLFTTSSLLNAIGDYTSGDLSTLYAARSNHKIISPYLLSNVALAVMDSTTDAFGDTVYYWKAFISASVVTQALVTRFGGKWAKLQKLYDYDYNPINNYDMTESETESGTNTGDVATSGSDTGTVTNTGTLTHGETISKTSEATATTDNDVYGFNSSSAVNSNDSSGTNNVTETDTYSGSDTDTNTRTDDLTHTNVRTDNLAHASERTLTRSGNIGVTTTQQMLQSEIDLWVNWDYLEIVFADIDSVLTCPMY